MSNEETTNNNTSNYKAHVAGAGGGTLLVLVANNLPDEYKFKPWLIIIAPTASIATSTIITWLKNQIEAFIKKRNKEKAFAQIKEEIKEDLNNPHTSEEHKKELKIELETIEKLKIKSIKAKIENK